MLGSQRGGAQRIDGSSHTGFKGHVGLVGEEPHAGSRSSEWTLVPGAKVESARLRT
jgi:hypothetical protein